MQFSGLASSYDKGTRIEPHRHVGHQIVHARSGVMRVTTSDGSWVLPPGRALWVPAGCTHEILCRDAVEMRTVYLAPGLNAMPSGYALASAAVPLTLPGTLPENCVVWRLSALMREVILRIASEHDQRLDEHLFALLLAEIEVMDALPLYLPEPADPKIKVITSTLFCAPADDRTLEDWAAELNLSPRTLIRRFQAETGMTFRQWRRQARLLVALERLAAKEPVTSVAYDVGYEGLSAFIEAFREAFGVTPGQYFRD